MILLIAAIIAPYRLQRINEQTLTFSHVSGHVNEIYRNTQMVTSSTNELDEISRDIDMISKGMREIANQFKV